MLSSSYIPEKNGFNRSQFDINFQDKKEVYSNPEKSEKNVRRDDYKKLKRDLSEQNERKIFYNQGTSYNVGDMLRRSLISGRPYSMAGQNMDVGKMLEGGEPDIGEKDEEDILKKRNEEIEKMIEQIKDEETKEIDKIGKEYNVDKKKIKMEDIFKNYVKKDNKTKLIEINIELENYINDFYKDLCNLGDEDDRRKKSIDEFYSKILGIRENLNIMEDEFNSDILRENYLYLKTRIEKMLGIVETVKEMIGESSFEEDMKKEDEFIENIRKCLLYFSVGEDLDEQIKRLIGKVKIMYRCKALRGRYDREKEEICKKELYKEVNSGNIDMKRFIDIVSYYIDKSFENKEYIPLKNESEELFNFINTYNEIEFNEKDQLEDKNVNKLMDYSMDRFNKTITEEIKKTNIRLQEVGVIYTEEENKLKAKSKNKELPELLRNKLDKSYIGINKKIIQKKLALLNDMYEYYKKENMEYEKLEQIELKYGNYILRDFLDEIRSNNVEIFDYMEGYNILETKKNLIKNNKYTIEDAEKIKRATGLMEQMRKKTGLEAANNITDIRIINFIIFLIDGIKETIKEKIGEINGELSKTVNEIKKAQEKFGNMQQNVNDEERQKLLEEITKKNKIKGKFEETINILNDLLKENSLNFYTKIIASIKESHELVRKVIEKNVKKFRNMREKAEKNKRELEKYVEEVTKTMDDEKGVTDELLLKEYENDDNKYGEVEIYIKFKNIYEQVKREYKDIIKEINDKNKNNMEYMNNFKELTNIMETYISMDNNDWGRDPINLKIRKILKYKEMIDKNKTLYKIGEEIANKKKIIEDNVMGVKNLIEGEIEPTEKIRNFEAINLRVEQKEIELYLLFFDIYKGKIQDNSSKYIKNKEKKYLIIPENVKKEIEELLFIPEIEDTTLESYNEILTDYSDKKIEDIIIGANLKDKKEEKKLTKANKKIKEEIKKAKEKMEIRKDINTLELKTKIEKEEREERKKEIVPTLIEKRGNKEKLMQEKLKYYLHKWKNLLPKNEENKGEIKKEDEKGEVIEQVKKLDLDQSLVSNDDDLGEKYNKYAEEIAEEKKQYETKEKDKYKVLLEYKNTNNLHGIAEIISYIKKDKAKSLRLTTIGEMAEYLKTNNKNIQKKINEYSRISKILMVNSKQEEVEYLKKEIENKTNMNIVDDKDAIEKEINELGLLLKVALKILRQYGSKEINEKYKELIEKIEEGINEKETEIINIFTKIIKSNYYNMLTYEYPYISVMEYFIVRERMRENEGNIKEEDMQKMKKIVYEIEKLKRGVDVTEDKKYKIKINEIRMTDFWDYSNMKELLFRKYGINIDVVKGDQAGIGEVVEDVPREEFNIIDKIKGDENIDEGNLDEYEKLYMELTTKSLFNDKNDDDNDDDKDNDDDDDGVKIVGNILKKVKKTEVTYKEPEELKSREVVWKILNNMAKAKEYYEQLFDLVETITCKTYIEHEETFENEKDEGKYENDENIINREAMLKEMAKNTGKVIQGHSKETPVWKEGNKESEDLQYTYMYTIEKCINLLTEIGKKPNMEHSNSSIDEIVEKTNKIKEMDNRNYNADNTIEVLEGILKKNSILATGGNKNGYEFKTFAMFKDDILRSIEEEKNMNKDCKQVVSYVIARTKNSIKDFYEMINGIIEKCDQYYENVDDYVVKTTYNGIALDMDSIEYVGDNSVAKVSESVYILKSYLLGEKLDGKDTQIIRQLGDIKQILRLIFDEKEFKETIDRIKKDDSDRGDFIEKFVLDVLNTYVSIMEDGFERISAKAKKLAKKIRKSKADLTDRSYLQIVEALERVKGNLDELIPINKEEILSNYEKIKDEERKVRNPEVKILKNLDRIMDYLKNRNAIDGKLINNYDEKIIHDLINNYIKAKLMYKINTWNKDEKDRNVKMNLATEFDVSEEKKNEWKEEIIGLKKDLDLRNRLENFIQSNLNKCEEKLKQIMDISKNIKYAQNNDNELIKYRIIMNNNQKIIELVERLVKSDTIESLLSLLEILPDIFEIILGLEEKIQEMETNIAEYMKGIFEVERIQITTEKLRIKESNEISNQEKYEEIENYESELMGLIDKIQKNTSIYTLNEIAKTYNEIIKGMAGETNEIKERLNKTRMKNKNKKSAEKITILRQTEGKEKNPPSSSTSLNINYQDQIGGSGGIKEIPYGVIKRESPSQEYEYNSDIIGEKYYPFEKYEKNNDYEGSGLWEIPMPGEKKNNGDKEE